MASVDDMWEDIDDDLLYRIEYEADQNNITTQNNKRQADNQSSGHCDKKQCTSEAGYHKQSDKQTSSYSCSSKNEGAPKEILHSTADSSKKKTCNQDDTENNSSIAPIQKYRHGYLWVSDLSSQSWCEQQMVYGFTLPGVVEKKPEMTVGTSLHLARELEVQDVVQVKVTSDEDIFAIKVLNLYSAVSSLLTGTPIRREIPIFGSPFKCGIFLMGMIDEIRCDVESFTFDIFELKTRQTNCLPSKAQKRTHNLQVMIYKKLFDDLVLGNISKFDIAKQFDLKLDKKFGQAVANQMKSMNLKSLDLNALLDMLFDLMNGVPCISQMFIEYCYQQDSSTIAIQKVDSDNKWLEKQLLHHVQYWTGDREPCGVDIEDAWKCGRCDFSEVCEWRLKKVEECQQKNKIKSIV